MKKIHIFDILIESVDYENNFTFIDTGNLLLL